MISRPDLVHLNRAKQQSGADLHRLHLPPGVYTGIWWYARFPEHYAANGSLATKQLDEFDFKTAVDEVANVIRAVKADDVSLKLQQEFYEKSAQPPRHASVDRSVAPAPRATVASGRSLPWKVPASAALASCRPRALQVRRWFPPLDVPPPAGVVKAK